jgi:hypothetical protein
MATYQGIYSYYVVDSFGVLAPVPFRFLVDSGQTYGQMLAEGQALGSLLDALTGSFIKVASYAGPFAPDPGWKTAAVDGAANQDCARLAFTVDGSLATWSMVIPAILPAKLIGTMLNLADTDVQALLDHLLSPPSGFQYVSADWQSLTFLRHTALCTRRWGGKGVR